MSNTLFLSKVLTCWLSVCVCVCVSVCVCVCACVRACARARVCSSLQTLTWKACTPPAGTEQTVRQVGHVTVNGTSQLSARAPSLEVCTTTSARKMFL